MFSVQAGDIAAIISGQNLQKLPDGVLLMTFTAGGQMSKDISTMSAGVAIISEREDTRAVAHWAIDYDYPAATAPRGHRWQGYYTPEQPPRTLYHTFE